MQNTFCKYIPDFDKRHLVSINQIIAPRWPDLFAGQCILSKELYLRYNLLHIQEMMNTTRPNGLHLKCLHYLI
jgi:hypothetical protein